MHYAYTPYVVPSFLAAVVCWGIFIFSWRHRTQKRVRTLLFLSLAASFWAFGYTLEIAGTDLATKVIWGKIQYIAIPVIPPLFLTFTLQYTNRERWLSLRRRWLLYVLPVLMPILAFTTEGHGLIWKNYHLSVSGPFPNLVVTHGWMFWALWIYSQVIIFLSAMTVIYALSHFPDLFRGQARYLLLAVFAPWMANGLYVTGLNPVPLYDLTPFAFAISVTAFSWNFIRHQFIRLMPIAHQIVFENMQEGAIVLDAKGRMVEINHAAKQITGLSASAIGHSPEKLLTTKPEFMVHFQTIVEKKVDFYLAEKPPLYYELQISPIKNANQVHEGWLVLIRDITEYKHSEKRLQEAEAKYRALVENGPFITYIDKLDDMGSTDFISSQVEGLINYTAEELMATPTLWVDLVHPDDRARVLLENARHNQTGEAFHSEYRLLGRDGKMVWVLDNAVRIQISPHEPFYSMGVWQNITEQKQFSQQLIEKANELKRSNIDLQQFAYAVSHDLQEPLRTINTYIQLFQKRYPAQLDAEATEFMQFVVEGAHRMKNMIDDLLEYSRVSTLSHSHVLTDCNTVFQEQVLYLLPGFEKNEAQITCDELPRLIVDQVQIGQLFRNLLSNALKYRSAQPPTIHISAQRIASPSGDFCKMSSNGIGKGDGAWLFNVMDNGIGIASEFHERIFQIFQRLHTREEYPGTGIGLALCKRIVERHGGHIWVDSQPGAGSTFYFTLPALDMEIAHPHVQN